MTRLVDSDKPNKKENFKSWRTGQTEFVLEKRKPVQSLRVAKLGPVFDRAWTDFAGLVKL